MNAGRGILLFLMLGCAPEAEAPDPVTKSWLDCSAGGPRAPRGAGEAAITYGALVCAGQRPQERGISRATGDCARIGGSRIEVFPVQGTPHLCCIIPNREAQSPSSDPAEIFECRPNHIQANLTKGEG